MKPEWVSAIVKLGVPGAIAVFLVWRMAAGFEVFDVRLAAIEAQHVHASAEMLAAKDLAGRALMTNERVLWVLQVMCANEAKTNDARERCLSDGR
jgi:hypothetical protein